MSTTMSSTSTIVKTKVPKKIKTLHKRGGRHQPAEFAGDMPPQRRLTVADVSRVFVAEDDDCDDTWYGPDCIKCGDVNVFRNDMCPRCYYQDDMVSPGGMTGAGYDSDSYGSDSASFFSDDSDGYYGDYHVNHVSQHQRITSKKSTSKQQPLHVHSEACYKVVLTCGHDGCDDHHASHHGFSNRSVSPVGGGYYGYY